MQELHVRNQELQSRIGNLEMLLLSRLGQKEADRATYIHTSTDQRRSTDHRRDLSQSSASQLSYVNTEDQHQQQTSQLAGTRDPTDDSQPVTCLSSQRCLNDEPMLTQVRSGETALTGLQSARSAADLVRLHHKQF